MPRGKNSTSIDQLMDLMENVDVATVAAEERRLAMRLRAVQSLLTQLGGTPSWELAGGPAGGRGATTRGGRGPRERTSLAAKPTGKRGGRRGKRGAGWEAIQTVLKGKGGSGTSADVKDAWERLGSKTPRSVALASFVRSGKLKKKGGGRGAVYTLA